MICVSFPLWGTWTRSLWRGVSLHRGIGPTKTLVDPPEREPPRYSYLVCLPAVTSPSRGRTCSRRPGARGPECSIEARIHMNSGFLRTLADRQAMLQPEPGPPLRPADGLGGGSVELPSGMRAASPANGPPAACSPCGRPRRSTSRPDPSPLLRSRGRRLAQSGRRPGPELGEVREDRALGDHPRLERVA